MMQTKKRVLIVATLVVCLLLLSGIFLVSHRQGNARMSVNRTFGMLATTTTTATALLFSDNFSDNSQNWDVGNDSKNGSSINNGMLVLTATSSMLFREPFPSDTDYGDVAVTTNFTLLKGDENDSVGLYLRSNISGQGYKVAINGNDTYDIAKITVDANQKSHTTYLARPQSASSLHPKGQKNNLSVIMRGGNIVLLINNTMVKSVQDGDFASGKIMLFVGNGDTSDGVSASFDMVEVYAAPAYISG